MPYLFLRKRAGSGHSCHLKLPLQESHLPDETIEKMAQEDTYENGDRETELYRLVDEYIHINNLIDENVQNSISADFNFFPRDESEW